MSEIIPKQKNSPAVLAQVRADTNMGVVKIYHKLWKLHPNRVKFSDPDAVMAAIDEYLQFCEDHQKLPSVNAFCVYSHVTRSWFYKYINEHPGEATTDILQRFNTLCNGSKEAANERGALSDASMIYHLSNSNEGYLTRVEHVMTPVTNISPLEGLNAEEARKRLTESIPDEE